MTLPQKKLAAILGWILPREDPESTCFQDDAVESITFPPP